MDYQTLRGLITALLLVLFIGIVWWAYSSRQKKRFDEAANSIFEDEASQKKKPGRGES